MLYFCIVFTSIVKTKLGTKELSPRSPDVCEHFINHLFRVIAPKSMKLSWYSIWNKSTHHGPLLLIQLSHIFQLKTTLLVSHSHVRAILWGDSLIHSKDRRCTIALSARSWQPCGTSCTAATALATPVGSDGLFGRGRFGGNRSQRAKRFRHVYTISRDFRLMEVLRRDQFGPDDGLTFVIWGHVEGRRRKSDDVLQ